jgi:hypothetical protein
LKARQKTVQETTAWLASFRETHDFIDYYLDHVEAIDANAQQNLSETLKKQKAILEDTGRKALMASDKAGVEEQEKAADEAWRAVLVAEQNPAQEINTFVDLRQTTLMTVMENMGPSRAMAPPPTQVRVDVAPTPRRYQQLLRAFRLTDRQMTLFTGAIAIASGFYALYFTANAPAWGTPKDYLYALLWGSLVSEGLRGRANRRVAYVPSGSQKAIQSC